jgi:methylated-DNA-protein-cysteine methyltransferase related protein
MKDFSKRVIQIALSIPPGRVLTYGLIAKQAGGGNQAARSVNAILVKAYMNGEKDIPFHRVVYSNGKVFSDPSFDARRSALYKKEGISLDASGKITNFRDVLWVD